jgi:hypothetical protein
MGMKRATPRNGHGQNVAKIFSKRGMEALDKAF